MSEDITQKGVPAKLLYVLTSPEKKQLLVLFPAVVLMAVLDTVGIASIIPFLGLLSDPNAIDENALLSWLYGAFPFESRESLFFFVGLGVLSILTFGNAFGAATTWALLRFSWMRNHSLSMRLLEGYASRPYSFFLTQNTSELSHKILAEVQQVVSGVIVQSMQLGARAVVIAFILMALLVLDPFMAIGVGALFGGLYGTLFWTVKRKLARLGKERVTANRQRFKLAAEMLSGIKEVKLAGLEQTFLRRYARPSERYADAVATGQTLSLLPKFALETVAFGGVLVMVLWLLHAGRSLQDALPFLGLYAFASYRMLPALQIVFAGLSSLRTSLAALDVVLADIAANSGVEARTDGVPEPLTFERSVSVEHIGFTYSGTDRPVLSDLTLDIECGEWVAFIGPTGSGKSTLVDIFLGLLEPSHGTVRVDGVALDSSMVRRWQRQAGYVPQQIFLADDTVAHNIAFGLEDGRIDQERLRTAARIAQIGEFIESELSDGYETVIGERGIRLSGGQRQRLGIARALYREPRFLVLDEATSALDGATEQRVFEALRHERRRCTVVSIAHRLTTTRDFDRIYVLERGELLDFGTFEELRQRNDHFAAHRHTEQ